MKAIIIDDSTFFCEYFKKQVEELARNWDLCLDMNIAKNINDVLLSKVTYDVYFIDIEMPEMSGLELVRQLRDTYVNAEFIFVSAYDKYMQEAFFVKPSAFIRKDYLQEDLASVICYLKRLENRKKREILLPNGRKNIVVNPYDIMYCKSVEHYVSVVFQDGSIKMLRSKMDDIDEKLKPYDFERIHRRYLVSLFFIDEVLPGNVRMMDGEVLEVSRRRKDRLEIVLMNWFSRN